MAAAGAIAFFGKLSLETAAAFDVIIWKIRTNYDAFVSTVTSAKILNLVVFGDSVVVKNGITIELRPIGENYSLAHLSTLSELTP
jgi:hypothetical protein